MNRRLSLIMLIVLSCALSLRAQGQPDVFTYASPVNIEFMSGPIAFDTEPVIGSPYSAEAVTDVVQHLADGNRIVRQSKAQISRDSQGRTRREQGFAMLGPLVNDPRGNEMRNVQISDPTTGSIVMLDLNSRTAHKLPGAPHMIMGNKIAIAGGTNTNAGVQVEKFEVAVPPPHAAGGRVMVNRMEAVSTMPAETPAVESLGTQFMEGVTVEGTRTTLTIPAGQIGNDLPINVVSERWFSPDLKVLVMSRQSDPRFGETTYRLTNINRSEPSPQLFEIPADFTVLDPEAQGNMVIERKIVK